MTGPRRGLRPRRAYWLAWKFFSASCSLFRSSGDNFGRSIVSASFDKKVKLWDAETLKEKLSITVNDQACDGAVFTPDGRRLVTAGWGTDRDVRLWDAESGKELRRFEGHTSSVINVAVTSDGKHIVSAGTDSVIRMWPLK